MNKKIKIFVFFIILTFIISCDSKEKQINLAVNEWIGYAPIFYANEKGWLKQDNIRLIRTVSLGESLNLYKSGLVNSLAATQYEYKEIKKDVIPVILLDKSYGGDMLFSNKTIDELVHTKKKIDVYLEIDSVNYLLLKYFIKKHHISINRLNLINKDQQQLLLTTFDKSKPILIITYAPYNIQYLKKGFHVIASTKTDKTLLVIDAIFTDKNNFSKNRFILLKKYIDQAINDIKNDPKKAYLVIQKYFPDYSYKDFKEGLKNIKWINNPNQKLKQELIDIDFYTKGLVK